ncbi:MAG: hypothetical protein ACC742_14520 [Thermoanaerobaculales bacterium]
MMKSQVRIGWFLVLAFCITIVLVPLLAVQSAEAVPCELTQDPFWATYTGGPEGCSGAASNCQVFDFDC